MKMDLKNNLPSDVEIPTGKQFKKKMLLCVTVTGLISIDMILPKPNTTHYSPMHTKLHGLVLSSISHVALA